VWGGGLGGVGGWMETGGRAFCGWCDGLVQSCPPPSPSRSGRLHVGGRAYARVFLFPCRCTLCPPPPCPAVIVTMLEAEDPDVSGPSVQAFNELSDAVVQADDAALQVTYASNSVSDDLDPLFDYVE
jgi:hypothetical protein